jgi:hypothetical protein
MYKGLTALKKYLELHGILMWTLMICYQGFKLRMIVQSSAIMMMSAKATPGKILKLLAYVTCLSTLMVSRPVKIATVEYLIDACPKLATEISMM